MMVSLDGFFEGPNHDLSWHNVDREFNEFAVEQTSEVGTLILGRRTYELFHDFWPNAPKDPNLSKEDLIIADLINNMPKIVFSRTMMDIKEEKNWKNVTLKHKVDPEEIKKLKEQPGPTSAKASVGKKDIAIFGSNHLCVSLMKEGLVDEFRIMLNPVVIGEGHTLFTGLNQKLNLKLIKTRNFKNGNVLLYYSSNSIR